MISVTEANNIIRMSALKKKSKNQFTKLENSFGLVLSEDIKAKCFSPPYHQSAMDGYALRFDDVNSGKPIKFEASKENSAGKTSNIKIKPNTAIRIFTGAKLPTNADLVIPQEFIEIDANQNLIFDSKKFSRNDNIRPKGSQFNKGTVVLKSGTVLNGANIALAATAGYSQLKTVARPSVSIIVSGNELTIPGKSLMPDQVYESNSIMLASLLHEKHIAIDSTYQVKDKLNVIEKTIKKCLRESDIILISGGISVGKYDYVKEALKNIGVKTGFYKVKQKPGKPLYFGTIKNKFVFGLPGNPAAALTCYYEYVLPLINILSGNKIFTKTAPKARLINEYRKKAGLTHFLKGYVSEKGAQILSDQESYKLTSFVNANCLIVIPEETEKLKKGDIVEYHLL